MVTAQSPPSATKTQRPKSGRKPLQPKNSQPNPTNYQLKSKLKPDWIEISLIDDSNKENLNHQIYATPTKIEKLDASLAEELSAIREKLDRLRLDKEKTEELLRERDMVLEIQMKELENRGEMQKKLEMEVDRLYRLKELRSLSMVSPIRSLREKEGEKNI